MEDALRPPSQRSHYVLLEVREGGHPAQYSEKPPTLRSILAYAFGGPL